MPLKTPAIVSEARRRLHKDIDARTHGIIDYCHVALFLTLGFIFLKSNKRAAAASFTTSGLLLVQSQLTDYPLGARPVIPFHLHGQMDGAFASTSWALPYLFGFADTGPAKIFTAGSVTDGVVVALTDFSSSRARSARRY